MRNEIRGKNLTSDLCGVWFFFRISAWVEVTSFVLWKARLTGWRPRSFGRLGMDENLIYGECQPPQGRGPPRKGAGKEDTCSLSHLKCHISMLFAINKLCSVQRCFAKVPVSSKDILCSPIPLGDRLKPLGDHQDWTTQIHLSVECLLIISLS